MAIPAISVIIPTYNEEQNIQSVIEKTKAADHCEVIVVDGGSTDQTIAKAKHADIVIESKLGRAVQQNAGANQATGEILLFLHADCELLPEFANAVEECLSKKGVVAGCFRQLIDHPAKKYRTIEKGNAWRVRNLGWIYGDQGLFLKREIFEQLGGFPEMPLMEDLYFSKRLKKEGKLIVSDHCIKVSARRWEKNGVIRQTARNWGFVTLAHLGVKPETLASWYGHVREADVTPS
ncbi:MAG: glycosyltransferase [Planctomicrobium sp.]|jgi:rSAM/selenodomain-associated transferase 2|nr:glycosyltransferase [Planctomicrobium sp.]